MQSLDSLSFYKTEQVPHSGKSLVSSRLMANDHSSGGSGEFTPVFLDLKVIFLIIFQPEGKAGIDFILRLVAMHFDQIFQGVLDHGIMAETHDLHVYELRFRSIDVGLAGQTFGCNKNVFSHLTPSFQNIPQPYGPNTGRPKENGSRRGYRSITTNSTPPMNSPIRGVWYWYPSLSDYGSLSLFTIIPFCRLASIFICKVPTSTLPTRGEMLSGTSPADGHGKGKQSGINTWYNRSRDRRSSPRYTPGG
jgi:hypothetical protein